MHPLFGKSAWRLLPLAILLLTTGCEEVPPPQSPQSASPAASASLPGLRFVRGYEAGLHEAARQNRPMLVFFTAQWCHYCHQMADEVFTDEQVCQLAERFVCVVVDADTESAVCEQLAVKAFPTVQFLSPQGVPMRRLVGKKEAAHLAYEMRVALESVAQRVRRQPRL